MLGSMLFKTKEAHVPRGRKYPDCDACLNMNMVPRIGLPFTSVYKPNLEVIFIMIKLPLSTYTLTLFLRVVVALLLSTMVGLINIVKMWLSPTS